MHGFGCGASEPRHPVETNSKSRPNGLGEFLGPAHEQEWSCFAKSSAATLEPIAQPS